jgi:hypothetical protein
MPAYDQCHDQVIRALQKEGWSIRSQQYKLAFEGRKLYVDVEAVRGSNGTGEHILLVEIKCFADRDRFVSDLYNAIGQYILYREIVNATTLPLPLYLTIPLAVYNTEFNEMVKRTFRENRINSVLIDLDQEEVVRWIK